MNMRLFRVLFGFFWFVGGVGNPLFSSERISCEPLEEEASWSVCLQDGLDSLLQDELLLTSQLGLCVFKNRRTNTAAFLDVLLGCDFL